MKDVIELPESELMKSKTWRKYADACGRCTSCGEHCSLLDPCCGRPVHFEGGEYSFDSLWERIEDELAEAAKDAKEDRDEAEGTGN